MLVLDKSVIHPRCHSCLRSVHRSIHVYQSAPYKVISTPSTPPAITLAKTMASFSLTATFSRHHRPHLGDLPSTTFNHTAFSRKVLVSLFASLTWVQKQVRLELASAKFDCTKNADVPARVPLGFLDVVVRGNATHHLAQQQLGKHSRQEIPMSLRPEPVLQDLLMVTFTSTLLN